MIFKESEMFKCKDCGEQTDYTVKEVYLTTNETKQMLEPEKKEETRYNLLICNQCKNVQLKAK